MPELPEVETIRRGLQIKISGRCIQKVQVHLPKQIRGMGVLAFCRALKDQRILDVRRRSKFLIFGFQSFELYIHLGMTGQVTYWDHHKTDDQGFVRHRVTGLQKTLGQHTPDKHTHVLFYLNDGDRIQYRDIRQFGYLSLLKPSQKDSFGPLNNLGVEPLDKAFTWKAFEKLISQKRGGLKAMLLSQRPVCGLGNIYADEVLHCAGLHPQQRMESLDLRRRRALYRAIPTVLKKALQNGGTTFSDFVDAQGAQGRNAKRLKVYGRAGKACTRCGRKLKKIFISQRSTVFCETCQKKQ